MFQAKVVEKIITNNQCTALSSDRAVNDIMWEKYGKAGQGTDDNMAHVHCMLDNEACIHTLGICNTYCSWG